MTSVRISALAFGFVASVFTVGITTGCAGKLNQDMSTASSTKDNPEMRGYDLGYRVGKAAGQRGAKADATMPGERNDPQTAAAYTIGYQDGFAGRENRYGSVNTRDWMHEQPKDPDISSE